MPSSKYSSQKHAEPADNDVCDSKEGIFAAHDGGGGNHDGFSTAEDGDVEFYNGWY